MYTKEFEIQLTGGAETQDALLEKLYLLDTELQDKFLKPLGKSNAILDYIFNNFDEIELTPEEARCVNDLFLRIHRDAIKMYQKRIVEIGKKIHW